MKPVKLTHLQILGCELHQDGFGGLAKLGPDEATTALPHFRYPLLGGRERGEEKETVGSRNGGGGRSGNEGKGD